MLTNNFGEFLYELRKEKNLTQTELADMLDLTNKAVSKWETGETMPETAQLVPLAKIFNLTVDELLNGRRNEAQPAGRVEAQTGEARENGEVLSKQFIVTVACGVGTILLGAVTMLILLFLNIPYTVYIAVLLGVVAVGAPLCAYAGMIKEIEGKYTAETVRMKGRKIALAISAGVALCILSPISIIALSDRFDETAAAIAGLTIFFLLIIAAVVLFIIYGLLWKNLMSKPAAVKKREVQSEKIIGAVSGAIMLLATAVFLILGFTLELWNTAWIVFPIGGILCGIVSTVMQIFNK